MIYNKNSPPIQIKNIKWWKKNNPKVFKILQQSIINPIKNLDNKN